MGAVTPSAAILAMRAGRWDEAANLWRKLLADHWELTASEYNACCRVWERLGQWQVYEEVIFSGLRLFPDDHLLRVRERHAQGIACMNQACWQQAWAIFEELRKIPFNSEWPCGRSYWSRQARYEKTLAPLKDRKARLLALTELSLLKASELLPQRIAGILLTIDCLDLPSSTRVAFRQRLEPVIGALRCYEQSIDLIEDPALAGAVASLAEFWQAHESKLTELAPGDYEFFARLFIRYGYPDLYLRLRTVFVAKLARIPEELNGKAMFAYRVALANEEADSAVFARCREAAAAQEETRTYVGISAVYHAGERYVDSRVDEDDSFAGFIKGRRIAIVGPVDVGLDSGKEIDGFDRIIRFNYRRGLGYESVKFGSRTDISYYVRAMLAKETPPPGILEGMSEIEYAVLEQHAWQECPWLKSIKCRTRVRPDHWHYFNNPMLVGLAFAVPRAVLDILRFEPAEVKVFCSDLFTSMTYRPEYLKGFVPAGQGRNMMRKFGLHDPVSNFVLMRRLRETGRIKVDTVLEEVLSLTVSGYMDCLKIAHAGFLADGQESG